MSNAEEYPRYLVAVGEAEAAFVSAEEAKTLLGAERSDVTFYGKVQVSEDCIVSISYDEMKEEIGVTGQEDVGQ